jgi:lipid-binding SYLF domain-containing protein
MRWSLLPPLIEVISGHASSQYYGPCVPVDEDLIKEFQERRCQYSGTMTRDLSAGPESAESERSSTMSWKALIAATLSASLALVPHSAIAQDKAAELSKNAHAALDSLYAKVAGAKALGAQAHAILVFPTVTKAGLGFGGLHGDGALIKGGKTVAYYSTSGGSFGLQAGVQTYGYAMFFMNDKALEALDKANGFEVGVGPSVVVMDEGMAKSSTTTTMKDDIYAFIFGQKGLMAGLGIQGNKITKVDPK